MDLFRKQLKEMKQAEPADETQAEQQEQQGTNSETNESTGIKPQLAKSEIKVSTSTTESEGAEPVVTEQSTESFGSSIPNPWPDVEVQTVHIKAAQAPTNTDDFASNLLKGFLFPDEPKENNPEPQESINETAPSTESELETTVDNSELPSSVDELKPEFSTSETATSSTDILTDIFEGTEQSVSTVSDSPVAELKDAEGTEESVSIVSDSPDAELKDAVDSPEAAASTPSEQEENEKDSYTPESKEILEDGWRVITDKITGRTAYLNESKKEMWQAILDQSSGRYYYWNPVSNDISWINPAVEETSRSDKLIEDNTQKNCCERGSSC